MARITIRSMVTQDLHYCCLWFFFTRFRKTGVVADRLGVSPQAVRASKSSCGGCAQAANCMDKKVTLQLKPRQARCKDM